MATNIGFDNEHPFVEEGADEGELSLVGDRVSVTSAMARAVAFTLERSVDGGTTWEPVLAETISGGGANLVDWESLSHGETQYRAVAFTVEGATAETTITVEARSGSLWLSGGPAFGVTGRLPFDPSVEITAGRARALKQYAGRAEPVALSGEALARVVSVAGTTADEAMAEHSTADVEQLTFVAQLAEALFLYRDPDGRRIYGGIDSIDMSRKGAVGSNGIWGYAFTLTEADRSGR